MPRAHRTLPALRLPARQQGILLPLALAAMACGGDDATLYDYCADPQFSTPYAPLEPDRVEESQAKRFAVKLLEAWPSPAAQGLNRWRVQLLDEQGEPNPKVVLTGVRPYMPDHKLDTAVVPEIGDANSGAVIEVSQIDFPWRGVWTLTFAGALSGQVDEAVFGVCVNP